MKRCIGYFIVVLGVNVAIFAGCDRTQPVEEAESLAAVEGDQAGVDEESPGDDVSADESGAARVPVEIEDDGEQEETGLIPECEDLDGLPREASATAGETHENFQRFRDEVEDLGEGGSKEDAETNWQLEKTEREACARWIGHQEFSRDWPGEHGGCFVSFQFGGDVAKLSQTIACGDTCSSRRAVWRRGEPEAVEIKAFAFATLHLVSSGNMIVFHDEGLDSPVQPELFRFDLDTGQRCRLTADCFSPTIAPDGETVVCRNRDADVLTVPITGGEPVVVKKADKPSSHDVYIRWHWGDFPTPVDFVADDRMKYSFTTLPSKSQGEPAAGELEHVEKEIDWPVR